MPDPQPSPQVQPGEPITRHCISTSGHMRRGLLKAKYALFLPLPHLELSVARSEGLDAGAIREIGMQHVCASVKGHASVAADVALQRGLTFDANGVPYARHADILGWSGDEARDRVHAVAMADASTLVEYA